MQIKLHLNEFISCMVVKNQIKFVKRLQQKKYRNRSGMFVVEGVKSVQELLNSHYALEKVYTTDADLFDVTLPNIEKVAHEVLGQMTGLQNANTVLGVFHIPTPKPIDYNDWVLVLDDVRDPGNLGTIIRLCDWFGIKHLVCSASTVDCYNPKVLQATMGSITRVNIGYTDLARFLKTTTTPVYGAFMEGESVYGTTVPETGVLVMGNEANGISESIEALIAKKITIPRFGERATESLNVAMATAILLNELRRGY